MRDIKFRGKRVDNGQWVHGCPIYMSYRAWIKDVDDKTTNPRRLDGINHTADIRCVEVIPSTVGQFTSRTDKNGKEEVYEDDVIGYRYGLKLGTGIVKFIEFGFAVSDGENRFYPLSDIEDVEILGSIHNNPNLLESEA